MHVFGAFFSCVSRTNILLCLEWEFEFKGGAVWLWCIWDFFFFFNMVILVSCVGCGKSYKVLHCPGSLLGSGCASFTLPIMSYGAAMNALWMLWFLHSSVCSQRSWVCTQSQNLQEIRTGLLIKGTRQINSNQVQWWWNFNNRMEYPEKRLKNMNKNTQKPKPSNLHDCISWKWASKL